MADEHKVVSEAEMELASALRSAAANDPDWLAAEIVKRGLTDIAWLTLVSNIRRRRLVGSHK